VSFGANTVAEVRGITVQADGKIVLVGREGPSSGFNFDAAMARLNADGSLDTSFGTNGLVVQSMYGSTPLAGTGDTLRHVFIYPTTQKIMVGGWVGTSASGANAYNFVAARYNTNGTLDTSFGTNGMTILTFTNMNVAWTTSDINGMTIDSAGDIILVGAVETA